MHLRKYDQRKRTPDRGRRASPGVSADTVRRPADDGEPTGPFRAVAPVSRESVEEPAPEPGAPAIAVIKSADMAVEKP